MPAKEILIWPDPRLLKVSEPVTKVDDGIRALVQDLKDTMLAVGDSAGLAAPQIGVLKRLFLVNIPPEHNDGNGTNGTEVFINPEFITKEGSFSWEEGCLSIPDLRGTVTRHMRVVMKYLDLEGNEREVEAFDYFAGCLQHENDHLNGKLWIDYQGPQRKDMVRKKMQKLTGKKWA